MPAVCLCRVHRSQLVILEVKDHANSGPLAREIDKGIKMLAHQIPDINRELMALTHLSARISAQVPSPAPNGDIQARQPEVLLQ